MAGRRAGTGRPRRSVARPARQRASLEQKVARAQGDPRRLAAVAFDHLRMVMSDCDAATRTAIAAEFVRAVTPIIERASRSVR